MAWRQALKSVGVLVVAGLTCGLWPAVAAAEDTVAFTMADARITESSGLAADPAGRIYWTVNDSGDSGLAYGITPAGKVKGTLGFRVAPVDVEAAAFSNNRLYLGDIGDNQADRREITVYYFDNPRPTNQVTTYNAWDFRYPDGKHDAETLLVSPTGGLYIVTKGGDGAIYVAPKAPSSVEVNTLTKVADAPDQVTDGVFLPDGSIALLTYASVEVIDAKTYKSVASATIPKQKQAESLSLSLDGTSLLVGSEGTNSKVYSMAVPASANPSPTPSAAADAGPEPDDTEDDPANSAAGNRGTWLAVGVAGFVAVVAGVVVGFVRRPGSP